MTPNQFSKAYGIDIGVIFICQREQPDLFYTNGSVSKNKLKAYIDANKERLEKLAKDSKDNDEDDINNDLKRQILAERLRALTIENNKNARLLIDAKKTYADFNNILTGVTQYLTTQHRQYIPKLVANMPADKVADVLEKNLTPLFAGLQTFLQKMKENLPDEDESV